MSLEEKIAKSLGNDSESFQDSQKRSKIVYTRDFLLSLSELDVCKALPSGFDSSLLSELEDGYHGTQDRLRNPGSLPLQSHRRTDYSSSPPTTGDSSNFSRGVYGRWDNRSSVRSDRDNDMQLGKDSDSGHAVRKPWQSSEHDGLLGSGSFAKPPGFASGWSGQKGRSNDQYQLKKSNEPYQPPRPYKAGPLSRREITDSLNDETFGSSDRASQDQAEEERRRRESFELMRKEQLKSLQEKQNLTTSKLKKDHTTNFNELIGESAIGNRNMDESVTQSLSNNDSSKTSLQASMVIRPLVPPGFRSTIAEKNSSTTSIVPSRELEVEIPNVQEIISHAKTITQDGVFGNREERPLVQKMGPGERDASVPTIEKGNELSNLSTNMEMFNEKYNSDKNFYRASSLSKESETQGVCEIVKGDTKKVTAQDFIDPSKQAQHPSILDKLFGSVTDNLYDSSDLVNKQDAKEDDPWTQANVIQSSKFAQWFSKDGIPAQEKKGTEDQAHARPNDLLSIIGGGERGGSQASDLKLPQEIPSDFPFSGSVITDGYLTSDTISSSVGLPKNFHKKSSKEDIIPPVLTCEDLEQTILSGYSGSSSTLQQALQVQNIFGSEEPKTEADNGASQHLLSLLQKGPVIKDTVVPSTKESGFSGEKVESLNQPGKSLTLETLFGSAFMKELQSAEAPVSALGSAAKIDINGPSSIDGSNMLQSKSDNFRSLFGIFDTQVDSDTSKQQMDILSKHGGFDGRTVIQLPEEGSLIGVGDPVNTHNSVFNPFGNLSHGESQSSYRPTDISDKLASLITGFENERPSMHGRHGSLDHAIPFHNLQSQSQMNHARLFSHQLEPHPSHASPTMNFLTQEGTIHHGGSMNHQLPPKMVHPPSRYPSRGQAGFEPPHPILQQMQMQRHTPNNVPQHLQEYNRGAPLPTNPRARSSMQEHYPFQAFPFEQRESNFGGPGMAMQAPGVSGNHPEAFQKLLEMELRANSSKRMHPFASLGNNSQGLHGHNSDPSFRYG